LKHPVYSIMRTKDTEALAGLPSSDVSNAGDTSPPLPLVELAGERVKGSKCGCHPLNAGDLVGLHLEEKAGDTFHRPLRTCRTVVHHFNSTQYCSITDCTETNH